MASVFGGLGTGNDEAFIVNAVRYLTLDGKFYERFYDGGGRDTQFAASQVSLGSAGSDSILASIATYGRGGDEYIVAGSGDQLISGGAGADTFRFQYQTAEDVLGTNQTFFVGGVGGYDVITDFNLGEGDRLSLENGIKIHDVVVKHTGTTSFRGIDTGDNPLQYDVVFTMSDGTGHSQEVTLVDAWGVDRDNSAFTQYLSDLGYQSFIRLPYLPHDARGVASITQYGSKWYDLYGTAYLYPDDNQNGSYASASVARGGAGDDNILSAGTMVFGRAGNDDIILTQFTQLASGGVGADTFRFVQQGFFDVNPDPNPFTFGGLAEKLVITDFDVRQGDQLSFTSNFHITGITVTHADTSELPADQVLNNSKQYDVVLTVEDDYPGFASARGEIVLVDAWGATAINPTNIALLKSLGYDGELLFA